MKRHAFAIACLALAFACFLSLITGAGLGENHVGLFRIVSYFMGGDDTWTPIVLFDLRLPRTILGALVGAALGLAGIVLQTTLRNPLAEPGLLGVGSGSAFAVVMAIFLGITAPIYQVPIAVAGAAAGCLVALAIARPRGGMDDPVRLILAGAAINGLLGAAISIVLLTDQKTADELRFWTIGSLSGRDLDIALRVIPVMLLGIILTVFVTRALSAMSVGEHIARGLGHNPQRIRKIAMFAVALLVGAATATCGPVTFVGLVAPFVARGLVGPTLEKSFPLSAVVGAILVIVADIVTRIPVRPSELSLGIVTAVIGAPVLIAVVRGRRMPGL
ncbi:iron ABC transporter permease [Thalassospira sp. MA62]|nr:iron ABC transporter permease [Thalassospira sp. MA62]